jgi:hypothetical protein
MDVCQGHYNRFRDTGKYRPEEPFRRNTVLPGTVEERFWGRVDRTGDCWVWQGRRWRDYGSWTFHVGEGKRRTVPAHRFAWELARGVIPEGMYVCHKCDNPPCCNPAHLFLGTHDDNMRDKAEKGRVRGGDVRGERNPHSKLTADQVLEIRRRAAKRERQCNLAREFGITPQATWNIINRRVWKHI